LHANADTLSRYSPLEEDAFKTRPIPGLLVSPVMLGIPDEDILARKMDVHLLREYQLRDEWCIRMRKLMEENEKPEFVVDTHGVLCKVDLTHGNRMIVPLELTPFILRHYHGAPMTGHLGATKVTAQITKRFYWQGLHEDVQDWIGACMTCKKRKTPRPKGGQSTPMLSDYPWEVACIDFVGPLPPTPNGNKYILVIIDTFTRYPICVPCPNATADVVADALYKHLFSHHGMTKCIVSDRANCFKHQTDSYIWLSTTG
jgi:hypothetical protein